MKDGDTSKLFINVFKESLSQKNNFHIYFRNKFYETNIWKANKRPFIMISFTYQGVVLTRVDRSLLGKYLNGISVILL